MQSAGVITVSVFTLNQTDFLVIPDPSLFHCFFDL